MSNILVFSDFDGTISKQDILDNIITQLYSFDKYKEVEKKLLSNEISYEKYLFDMFNNINYDLNNLPIDIIDDKFIHFYKWINEKNIDFYIISSGFKKIISYLIPFIPSNIIYGNDISINNQNLWNVSLYNGNQSIDKNIIINELKKTNYKTIFIGDGLSDFKVMNKVDFLFCKKNSLLHLKCIEENCPYIVFEDFSDVLTEINNIMNSISIMA
jgi:2,3-diketo-5-methylthio-1-phosphopentane phosphatase